MSELAEARPKGYFLDDEEDAEGVCCIGSPIVVDGGVCAGAISVTGLKVDVPGWRLHQIGEGVRDHAAQVSRAARVAGGAGVRRALIVEAPGRLALLQRDSLEPGPGEVVIRPAFCGLCGTDIELRDGLVDPAFVRYPLTLGHEWSGVVQAVGTGVPGIAPGDRVVAECIIPCGTCGPCRVGRHERLHDLRGARLHPRRRGERRRSSFPRVLVHVLAPAVPLLDAALVEPTSVVMRGLEKATPEPGERVLVIGDGTIGLLAAHLAGLWSPAEIVMLGRRPEQAALAETVGATAFTTDDAVAEGFDLVIEAAGASGGDGARRRARPGVAVACCCSACRRPGKRSSCPPTCS